MFLCSKGNFSKAYDCLFPGAPAPTDQNTVEKLADLHPFANTKEQWTEDLWEFISERKVDITEQHVRDYILKSDYLVGPGPFANPIDLFKQIMGSPNSIEGSMFITELTWIQNLLANEKLPEKITNILKYSSLFALKKDDFGRVRPIAMGETLRKMNASLIVQIVKAEAKEFFKGAQFGLESMGTEKILHAINYMRDLHPNWDLICLDHKNAFNLIERSAISSRLMTQFPHLVNYFRTYYFDSSSLLLCDPDTLDIYEFFSCLGVQQGDPMGTFLFAVATILHVRKIIEIVESGIAPALHDDINIVATFEKSLQALRYMLDEGINIGLFLQPAKTTILLGQCPSPEDALARKVAYQVLLGLTDAEADKCIKIHPLNGTTEDICSALDKSYGVRILGAPVGSDIFIKDWLAIFILKLKKEAKQLQSEVSSLQVQWSLIYYCLRNKVNHLFRVIPPRLSRPFASAFDDFLLSVMNKNLLTNLPVFAWTQVKLSFEEGGNGLGDIFHTSLSAYISSAVSCLEAVQEITHIQDIPIIESSSSTWVLDLWNSVSQFNNQIEGDRFSLDDLFLLKGPKMQHDLTKLLDHKTGNDFHNVYSNDASRARKLSTRCSESSGFLRATPNDTTLMSNEEWVLAIKLRLGLPLGIVSTNFKCICKGNPRVDQLGYHFMDCKHGGERHKTHDDLSSILVSMGRSAGVQCKLEPLLNSSVGSRRGDFLFIEPGIQFCKQVPELKDLANNVEVIGDVKVSFPSSKSYLNRKSYKHAGVAALDGYKKKLLKYHSGPDVLLGRGFIPISIEAFGRFHPSIKPFMSAICLKASAISGIDTQFSSTIGLIESRHPYKKI